MFDPSSPEVTRPVEALAASHIVPAVVRRRRSFFTLVAVVAAQLLLLSLQITRDNNVRLIRYWAVEVFDPFERALGGLADGATTAVRTYRQLWHAQQENQELHVQLVAAQSQIRQLDELAGESQRLRGLLEFKNQLPLQTVAAEVIASSPARGSNAIFIDKGSDYGLTTDLPVITPAGVVGKILAVFPHEAQVLLLTDASSGVGVTLAQSRVQGILKGGADGLCDVHYVMNEEAVNRGEPVVTSGLDRIYPKGVPVGTVVSVGDGNIYKSISVKPAVDLGKLEMVMVVTKTSTPDQQALNFPVPPK